MGSFSQVCKDTQEKLGRPLQKREIKFLQWVFDRYTKEEQQKEKEKTIFS
ncbi:hypothetical protein ABRT01_09250 [Lentibacillus sp. L22]|nr:hypothetical protein [Lentibacillus daqui]